MERRATWPQKQMPPRHVDPSVQMLPGQQNPPEVPHAVQKPIWQTSPALHVVPQHGWPSAPHSMVLEQVFVPSQVSPVPHVPPAQQTCPDAPHG